MSTMEPATPTQLQTLLTEARTATRAIIMQSHRAVELSDHDELFEGHIWRAEVEFRFIAVALRWLDDLAATANRTLRDPALADAIQTFRAALPEARGMRNIAEHLPDYILGQGYMQRRVDPEKRRGDQGWRIWAGPTGRPTYLSWGGTELDVEIARLAADRLFTAVRDAVESQLA